MFLYGRPWCSHVSLYLFVGILFLQIYRWVHKQKHLDEHGGCFFSKYLFLNHCVCLAQITTCFGADETKLIQLFSQSKKSIIALFSLKKASNVTVLSKIQNTIIYNDVFISLVSVMLYKNIEAEI